MAILVEAPGIEPHDAYVPSVAKRREDDVDRATQDDSKRREVSALTPRVRRSVSSAPLDTDEALGVAIGCIRGGYGAGAGVARRARRKAHGLCARPGADDVPV
jgi:hypothetical protein